ncbi:XRE family transcriptional regulator [Kitasatospora sp. NBC_01287]|uniref:helix-turn-helix domain-containing protein n=1 Tax=Kitasatospora sp. NBC_01287 TaxID=2903573 RepID=UPI00224E8AF7|nr:XRE family transcriptional regulator [Kitasatospora sp. NBC_01287]MCX4747466.1 XRE family transcriptional regulator [Kitasatospora sp. NBC_01287]
MTTEPSGATEPSGPSGPDEGELTGLGARLREHRLAARLTLEAAAARAGLSPAYLSRLETGRRQPSLPVLLALARLYGATVAGLLGEQAGAPDPVVRGGEIPPSTTGGWAYRRAGVPGLAMQALRVQIPPGLQDAVVRVHAGEEWLHVTRGRLRLTLGQSGYLLEPGDSAQFDSLTPHRFAAEGTEGVELLFVHTLLQSPASELCLPVPTRAPS